MFFFFNDTATTEIYTLSLHDALPIFCHCVSRSEIVEAIGVGHRTLADIRAETQASTGCGGCESEVLDILQDRKSTRLNSSHANISYAVFCLKKKKSNGLVSRVVEKNT